MSTSPSLTDDDYSMNSTGQKTTSPRMWDNARYLARATPGPPSPAPGPEQHVADR